MGMGNRSDAHLPCCPLAQTKRPQVINPTGQTLNIAGLTYTVPNGAPNPAGGNYPGVQVTGAARSSPGVPAPNPVGPKTVTYGAFSVGAKQTLKLAVTFES